MILKPNEVITRKVFSVVIGGIPGIGKTSLGLSAPNPILIDIDDGFDRVPAHARTCVGVIKPKNYQEILDDLVVDNISMCDSIVIDTGGALINFMKAHLIRIDPKNGQRDGQTLSMRGYGAAGSEFMRLCEYIKNTLQKNLVVLFHVKEEADGESKVFRLDVEGQTKNNIWKPMDLGGFMEMVGNKRTIGFSPTERYYAKSTHGIEGIETIPDIMNGSPNTFLTDVFARLRNNITKEQEYNKVYTDLMVKIRSIIYEVSDTISANKALETIGSIGHIFASKTESWHLLKTKCAQVGLTFDKDKKVFVVGTPGSDARRPPKAIAEKIDNLRSASEEKQASVGDIY